jgi:F-type H+-transporting ATPase subunit epsilon
MTDKYLKIDIITPQSVVYSDYAISVNVPGSQSPFEVLINHAAIVSSLDSGVIKIKCSDSSTIYFAVGTGFIEVKKNEVAILVETAVKSLDIDKSQVLLAIDTLKAEIASTSGNSEKLILATKLSYEQAKLKATTLDRRN